MGTWDDAIKALADQVKTRPDVGTPKPDDDSKQIGVCLKCGDEGLIGCGCDCCGGDVYRAQE